MTPQRRLRNLFGFLIAGMVAASLAGEPPEARAPAPLSSEEFFIVSSVDLAKSTLVLKRPTEVTLAMLVTAKTRIRNEQGKAIRMGDLRAGATVFIQSELDASGQRAASSVREGPMTVPVLRDRYLRAGPR